MSVMLLVWEHSTVCKHTISRSPSALLLSVTQWQPLNSELPVLDDIWYFWEQNGVIFNIPITFYLRAFIGLRNSEKPSGRLPLPVAHVQNSALFFKTKHRISCIGYWYPLSGSEFSNCSQWSLSFSGDYSVPVLYGSVQLWRTEYSFVTASRYEGHATSSPLLTYIAIFFSDPTKLLKKCYIQS